MSCGKKIYLSRGDAKNAMKALNQKFHNTKADGLKDAYYCEDCPGWHLTSMSKQMSRNMTRKLKRRNSQ